MTDTTTVLTTRQRLLTDLRQALNRANALAAYARRFQGDYTVDEQQALKETGEAADQYSDYWLTVVEPLFEALGRDLVAMGELPLYERYGDTPPGYQVVARVWYKTQYPEGTVW